VRNQQQKQVLKNQNSPVLFELRAKGGLLCGAAVGLLLFCWSSIAIESETVVVGAGGAPGTRFHFETAEVISGVEGEGDGEEHEMMLDISVVFMVGG
jgi:hypothetical protein